MEAHHHRRYGGCPGPSGRGERGVRHAAPIDNATSDTVCAGPEPSARSGSGDAHDLGQGDTSPVGSLSSARTAIRPG